MTTDRPFVLVIDDDVFVLSSIQEQLKSHFRLAFCNDSMKAPDLILKLKPDLVLTDANMPGMTGVGIIRWIRTNQVAAQIPVIIQSAVEDYKNESLRLLASGADLFLIKNSSTAELISAINNLIEDASDDDTR